MSPSAYLRGRGHSILYTLQLPRPPRAARRAGRQRPDGVSHRDLEGAAAVAAEVARPAVPGGARDQPSRRRRRRRPRGCASRWSSRRTSAAAAPASSASTRRRISQRAVAEGRVDLGLDEHRAGAGVHPGARRPHHPRRGARRQVPLRDQRLQHRRELQPVPGRHLPDERRRRAGARRVPGRRAEERPARRGATRRRRRSSPTSSGSCARPASRSAASST